MNKEYIQTKSQHTDAKHIKCARLLNDIGGATNERMDMLQKQFNNSTECNILPPDAGNIESLLLALVLLCVCRESMELSDITLYNVICLETYAHLELTTKLNLLGKFRVPFRHDTRTMLHNVICRITELDRE